MEDAQKLIVCEAKLFLANDRAESAEAKLAVVVEACAEVAHFGDLHPSIQTALTNLPTSLTAQQERKP